MEHKDRYSEETSQGDRKLVKSVEGLQGVSSLKALKKLPPRLAKFNLDELHKRRKLEREHGLPHQPVVISAIPKGRWINIKKLVHTPSPDGRSQIQELRNTSVRTWRI